MLQKLGAFTQCLLPKRSSKYFVSNQFCGFNLAVAVVVAAAGFKS